MGKLTMGAAVLVLAFLLCAAEGMAAHPAGKDCEGCHLSTAGGDAPKVVPKEPGFFARLFLGKESFRGHRAVACAGEVMGNGSVTGCHAVDKGYPGLLVSNLKDKPVDELCGVCHGGERQFGSHHPSYRVDKNGDGKADRYVTPVPGQEVFTQYGPSAQGEPLASHPDTLVIVEKEDAPPELKSAIPLATVVEQVSPTEVLTISNVVTCTSCHNPHFGYLSATNLAEELKPDAVARARGDAGLRLKDHNNALCLACH